MEEELVNQVEKPYDTKKINEIDISYNYVYNQISKKATSLIDNYHSGKIKDINRKDLSDILQIKSRFRKLALEQPEKAITHIDLYKVSYFHRIIHKYTK